MTAFLLELIGDLLFGETVSRVMDGLRAKFRRSKSSTPRT